MTHRTLQLLLVVVVATGAMMGVAAADGDVGIAVDDADGEPVVTVTENGTAAGNATVIVETVDENATYAGTGDYTTDENGTVSLPAPDSDVNVSVTATVDGTESTIETLLEASADDAESADGLAVDVTDADAAPTVSVTDNGSAVANASVTVVTAGENATYEGTGEYETDENGTVSLPAAEENVTVEVTAAVDNETATTTVDLVAADDADEPASFGQIVQEFIQGFSDDRSDGFGVALADFVTDNNPGNAPDHAGPGNASDGPGDAPDGVGPDDESEDPDNESEDPGNAPDEAGNGSDAGGPPDHAGNGDDADEGDDDADEGDDDADEGDDAEEDDADEDDDDDDDDDNPGQGNGPPN